jgi:metallophosphoesterase superfamily enzyme
MWQKSWMADREFYEFVMPAIDIIEGGNDVLPQLISRVLLRKVSSQNYKQYLCITANKKQAESWYAMSTGRSR